MINLIKNNILLKLFFLIILFFNFYGLHIAQAAQDVQTVQDVQVAQVKNKKILLQSKSENEKFQVDEIYSLFDSNHKRTGSVKIIAIKDTRAVARLIEGHAEVGQRAILSLSKESNSSFKFGIGLKLMQNDVSVVQSFLGTKETVNLSGTNFGFNTFLGYLLTEKILTKIILGFEMHDLKVTALQTVCGGSTTNQCALKANYLTVGGRLNYEFESFWLGIGGDYKSGFGIETNAFYSDDVKSKANLNFEIGKNFHFNQKQYIPISIGYEYSLNTSTDVPKISQIYLNLSYGFDK